MPIDLAAAAAASNPAPTNASPIGATDPDTVRRTDEARAAQLAQQRRLEEIQTDQQRAETARQQREERSQLSRNGNGDLIGTVVSTSA